MKKQSFILLLILEIIVGINAGAAFSLISHRFLAAVVASTGFLILGLFIFWLTYRLGLKKMPYLFAGNCLYMFGSVLPLMGTRLMDPSNEKLETIIGIDAKLFHNASEKIFLILVLLTVFELIRSIRSQKV